MDLGCYQSYKPNVSPLGIVFSTCCDSAILIIFLRKLNKMCNKLVTLSVTVTKSLTKTCHDACTEITSPSAKCSCKGLGPVIQKVYNAIHRINRYPVDKCWQHKLLYPLDNDLSNLWTTGACVLLLCYCVVYCGIQLYSHGIRTSCTQSSHNPPYLVCYIRYNIQYGRIGAANSEVEEAASAADMHTRILTFPNGKRHTLGEYQPCALTSNVLAFIKTPVGECGLNLNGGTIHWTACAVIRQC